MQHKQKIIIISLEIALAIIFILGSNIHHPRFSIFYGSYFADIFIPFSFYFLLFLVEDKNNLIKRWYVKAALIFLLCALSETLQYFGIDAFASVFDPMDYLMYGVGVFLAAAADRWILKKLIKTW